MIPQPQASLKQMEPQFSWSLPASRPVPAVPPDLLEPGHMGPGLGPLRGQESLGEFYLSRLLLRFFKIKKNVNCKNWDIHHTLHFSSLHI